jgi:hypothetical protein
MPFKKNNPGCPCCGCSLAVRIIRGDGCPAIGAHVNIFLGGGSHFSGDITDATGVITWTGATPGTLYTISWSYFSLSGSFNGGCGFYPLTIANPPDSGLWTNCVDSPPPAMYITDIAGTRQIWPTAECVTTTDPATGIPRRIRTGLSPNGPCQPPAYLNGLFEISTAVYLDAGTGCQFFSNDGGQVAFTMPCARPWYFEGTYPTGGAGLPYHIFAGTDFIIHE